MIQLLCLYHHDLRIFQKYEKPSKKAKKALFKVPPPPPQKHPQIRIFQKSGFFGVIGFGVAEV